MDSTEIIAALKQVDGTDREKVLAVGPFLVWSFRRTTQHPLLSAALSPPPESEGKRSGRSPKGEFLLISGRSLLPGQSVDVEVASCRVPHAVVGSSIGDPGQPQYSFLLLEERLQTVEIALARRLLSDLQRARLRLSLPVLVAVGSGGAGGAGQRLKYLGFRTETNEAEDEEDDPSMDLENLPPNRGPQAHQKDLEARKGSKALGESIAVRLPTLPTAGHEEVRIGDLLRRVRALPPEMKVELSCRYDLPPSLSASTSTSRAGAATLDLTGSTNLEGAAEAPLAQVVPALLATGAATLNLECGPESAGGGLEHELSSLRTLRRLLTGEATLKAGRGENNNVNDNNSNSKNDDSFSTEHGDDDRNDDDGDDRMETILNSTADATAAASAFLEEELSAGVGAPREEDKNRPNRDFLDKLWLRLLRRCASVEVLVVAWSSLLAKMGTADGVVPFIRRNSSLEAATLFRLALKVSAAQRYAGSEWEAAVREWKERCWYYSNPEHALRLALSLGADFLRRQSLHIITQQSSVAASDLGSLMMEEEEINWQNAAASLGNLPPPPSWSESPLPDALRTRCDATLRRLQCLLQVAEVADLAGRQFFDVETHRRLVLQAIDFFRARNEGPLRLGGRLGDVAPQFSVPLSRAAAERILTSALGSTSAPSRIRVRCGSDMLQADRVTSILDETGAEGMPGVWSVQVLDDEEEEEDPDHPRDETERDSGSRLHFHLTAVECLSVQPR